MLKITIYTDPLCCWTWGAAPHWQRLKNYLGAQAIWSLRMGGLIPSWTNFNDEVNSVTRPAQMGPVWMHAAQVTNRPVDYHLWITDPPSSSYPACLAVKAAQAQSDELGEQYFHMVQQACMQDRKNIAKSATLLAVASDLSRENPSFDINPFKMAYKSDDSIEAFRTDLQQVQYHRITRFPTLIIQSAYANGLMIAGFRPFADLVQAIRNGLPDFSLPSEDVPA